MTLTPIAKDSADVFGYTTAFDEALKKIGQISPQEFAQRYATPAKYLPQISFDPTTAKFWDDFNKNHLFQLNAEELAIFKKNGFVVSERLGGHNFADVFYRIYSHDLPVFVSADALLHAWHRSYDAILEELEETYLSSSLCEILEGMHEGIPGAWKQYGNGVLGDSLRDADYFLAVARSLLGDKAVKTYLEQDTQVAETLKAVQGEQLDEFELFGRFRQVDFSQFKVRGHYENSELLKRYFRAMMWCGRIDLRIAGSLQESSVRELGAAVVLCDLLKQCGKFEQWQQFDQLLQTFVGRTDSMTFAQLGGILDKAKIKSPADVKDWGVLLQLEADILAGKIGVQHIRSHYYESPFGLEKIKLPRSFTILGQKFVVDSWVTSKVVADDIEWDGEKVQRRVPSCLDVAFAALGNDQVVPELVARMTDTEGRQFRDGLNYQHNLAVVRDVIDEQNKVVWEENIYMSWLATLRELSAPTTNPKYPEAMRNRAWAMKTLNTQLASWTQLRHDTILYVKQSYTGGICCYYPAGFVEPRVEFWESFEKMAKLAADLMEKTSFPDRLVKKSNKRAGQDEVRLQDIQKKQTEFFKNFAEKLAIVKGIALKQLAQNEFTKAENQFLKKIVEIIHGGSGAPTYSGWYFGLFYKGHEDSKKRDAIVADVHTDVPAELIGDPGCVLHQGVGNVDLLMVAVDSGEDKMVYTGPVLSHYEFEMPRVSRKSDSEWLSDIKIGKVPPRPDWTKSYLVPQEILQLTKWLNLAGNELAALPPEICQFTNLTELTLSNNQLTTLPPEICQLTNLTKLDLSRNQLKALPAEIGKLTNLKELILSNNQLTALPLEIGQLTNLTRLDLSGNQLTVLPPEICQLASLTKLDLSRNQLTELSAEIDQLANLTQLSLGCNKLTELPAEIGQLTNLAELDLYYTQLTALPPAIGNLTHLTKLNLGHNQLTVLPSEIGQLINLRWLNISCNYKQLTELPPEIGQLTNLTELCLSCRLTALPPEIGNLTHLTKLNLHANQLTALPVEIGNLTNLTKLDLSSNRLTALPVEIGNLTNLRELNFHCCELAALPVEIGQLTKLTDLTLSGNKLTALPAEIGNLTNLTTLYLRSNQLTALPSEIGQLTNLPWLDLSNNQLTALPAEIGNLTNLTRLDLSDNQLAALPAEIGNLTNLKELNFIRNKLTALPPEIGNLTNLTELSLYNNQLTTLPSEIGNLTNLTNIGLSSNQLTVLPPVISQLINLTGLDISDNQLMTLPPEIGNLTNLAGLNISGSQLTVLPPEIGNLINLRWLEIKNNPLKTLPAEIGQLTHLPELDLDNNQLTALPPEIGQLTHLTGLNLSNNQLTALPPEIGQLTNLRWLDISNNQLTALPAEIGNLSKLRQFSLSGNQLTALPPEIDQLHLFELAKANIDVAQLVALNPSASPKLLAELAVSRDATTRENVAANPNTPTEVLLKLCAQFPEQLLNNPVFPLLLLENPNLVDQIPRNLLGSLLKLEQIPASLRESTDSAATGNWPAY